MPATEHEVKFHSIIDLANSSAFDRWSLTAMDPLAPHVDGHPIPVLTTLIHRVCQGDTKRFEEALRILRLAFEAGQRVGN